MEKNSILVNKNSILVKKDGFILHGVVRDINNAGVFFETNQKTSFISFDNIRELVPWENCS